MEITGGSDPRLLQEVGDLSVLLSESEFTPI